MGTGGLLQRSGSSSVEFLLAEGDWMERSDHNVLQDTFCFQLSTVFQFYYYIPFTEVESSRTHLKSLASKHQVLKNCPVLGSRTAVFFEFLKFCRSREKNFCRPCFFGDFLTLFFRDHLKQIFEDLFLNV